MVSGVREWTDVYTDDHMSRAVLRGGSYWSPLPQPAVVMRYFFNYSTDIGYTDGAPNWYYPNPLEPIEIGASNVKPVATPLTHHVTSAAIWSLRKVFYGYILRDCAVVADDAAAAIGEHG